MEKPVWQTVLAHDPVTPLLASSNAAIALCARRDLLGQNHDNIGVLWDLPGAQKILHRQQNDGGWLYPGGNHRVRTAENYNQLETFRQLGFLVEIYGFNRQHPAITAAAEYLLAFQTAEGDIRGILGNQYTPYYTAAILELLTKAGYADDQRVTKAFAWLKSSRQADGGWAIPLRTLGRKLDSLAMEVPTLQPDKSKPFSHLVTGVVLRAYAAHPVQRSSPEAQLAGRLLTKRLFLADTYPDRQSADFWLKFTFPFWFTDLISALDSLSQLGHSVQESSIHQACQWFINQQTPTGTWRLKLLKNLHNDSELWLSLAICRILQRLYH